MVVGVVAARLKIPNGVEVVVGAEGDTRAAADIDLGEARPDADEGVGDDGEILLLVFEVADGEVAGGGYSTADSA